MFYNTAKIAAAGEGCMCMCVCVCGGGGGGKLNDTKNRQSEKDKYVT